MYLLALEQTLSRLEGVGREGKLFSSQIYILEAMKDSLTKYDTLLGQIKKEGENEKENENASDLSAKV